LLPIVHHAISFDLLIFQVCIFYIKAGVVMVISKSDFDKFLSKKIILGCVG
jgi:hypothetical protein